MKKVAYQEMAENELTHPWYLSTRRLLLSTLKSRLNKESRILDAGCGTGGTMTMLLKNGFKNMFGIDSSPEAIKYCKKRNLKNVKLGTVSKIEFPSNSFDGIICLDVLYHKGVEPETTIREFFRLLKPNGVLYLQEPAYNWLRGSHDEAIDTGRRFNPKELRRLLKNSHFKILKVTRFNIVLLPLILVKRFTDQFSKQKTTKSDVVNISGPSYYIISLIFNFELLMLKFINLPQGLSIVLLAKK